jgi:hypothetical protein
MTTEDKIDEIFDNAFVGMHLTGMRHKLLAEAKASILKLIEPKDVTGTYYDSGEGR